MRKETVITFIYCRRLNGSMFLRLPKAAKQNEILLHVPKVCSNNFRKHFSRSRFATCFSQYLSQLSEVQNIQYILKIENEQYQNIKPQNIKRFMS
jgi:hypothetical protein